MSTPGSPRMEHICVIGEKSNISDTSSYSLVFGPNNYNDGYNNILIGKNITCMGNNNILITNNYICKGDNIRVIDNVLPETIVVVNKYLHNRFI